MPSGETAEQKTERPTRRKREKARQEGMVAQSPELNNALVLLAAVAALALFGRFTLGLLVDEVVKRLGNLSSPALTLEGTSLVLYESVMLMAKAVLPIVTFVCVAGLLCSVGQTGIIFAPKKLVPNLALVDPVKGLKNLLSLSSLVRLLVAVIKLSIIGVVTFLLLRGRIDWFFALIGKSTWGIFEATSQLCLSALLRIGIAMTGVAVLDYAYHRWRHEKQLMMTKAESKEERKREEGPPEVRNRQAQVRRELARMRMMQAVPAADVVVTNPTQLAVALKWNEKTMSAPQVTAKAKNHVAERIKQIAREHGVPVVERKALAQTLYRVVEIGMEIPAKLYYAVAEVLAFVMKQEI